MVSFSFITTRLTFCNWMIIFHQAWKTPLKIQQLWWGSHLPTIPLGRSQCSEWEQQQWWTRFIQSLPFILPDQIHHWNTHSKERRCWTFQVKAWKLQICKQNKYFHICNRIMIALLKTSNFAIHIFIQKKLTSRKIYKKCHDFRPTKR